MEIERKMVINTEKAIESGVDNSGLIGAMNAELQSDYRIFRAIRQLCSNRQFPAALGEVDKLNFESHQASAVEYIILFVCRDALSRLFYDVHCSTIQWLISALDHLVCIPSRTFAQLERCLRHICALSDEMSCHREFRTAWFQHIWPTARRLTTLFKMDESSSLVSVNCVNRFHELSCADKGMLLKQLARPRIHRLCMK